jgi:hypothetical protein
MEERERVWDQPITSKRPLKRWMEPLGFSTAADILSRNHKGHRRGRKCLRIGIKTRNRGLVLRDGDLERFLVIAFTRQGREPKFEISLAINGSGFNISRAALQTRRDRDEVERKVGAYASNLNSSAFQNNAISWHLIVTQEQKNAKNDETLAI